MPPDSIGPAKRRHSSERGAALLAVLAAVALLAGLASIGLSRLKAATATINASGARNKAMLLADSGVTAARFLVFRAKLIARQNGGKPVAPVTFPLAGGTILLRFTSGGNCFNLNALASKPADPGEPPHPPQAQPADFAKLLAASGIAQADATSLAEATAARLRATGLLWADGSEWVTVNGVTPAHWQAAGHLLCALPTREAAAIDINSLTVSQAPLLAGLGVPVDAARRLLAARPPQGWDTGDDFWKQAGIAAPAGNSGAQALRAGSRWMQAELTATTASARLSRQILLDTARQPAQIAGVRWGPIEMSATKTAPTKTAPMETAPMETAPMETAV